jgi:hypothetical protein
MQADLSGMTLGDAQLVGGGAYDGDPAPPRSERQEPLVAQQDHLVFGDVPPRRSWPVLPPASVSTGAAAIERPVISGL